MAASVDGPLLAWTWGVNGTAAREHLAEVASRAGRRRAGGRSTPAEAPGVTFPCPRRVNLTKEVGEASAPHMGGGGQAPSYARAQLSAVGTVVAE